MKKVKKIPQRKCIVCQDRDSKKELMRIVKNKEGEIFLDPSGRANGRGAYICKDSECLKKAIKTKALNRAFKVEVSDEVYEKLLALIRPICIGQASSIWNGYTNIEVDTRITTFNTSTMQKFQIQYKRAQYYNILSYAWDILSKDVNERTMLVADECHILIDPNIPQTLEYVRYISKMARKHNSSICVISQSIEDYLNEKIRLYGQSLLANSTNKLFFKCDGKDLKDIVNIFNLTEQEEKMILNAKVGECLFMCGTRKLYMIFKLFDYELEMIDSKMCKPFPIDFKLY